ncbi:MAG: Gfo/Idh/MocA family oxidoreductase [Pseudomonadota bacterium]
MSPLRVILVGLGARARTWAKVIDADPEVDIVAVCDPDPAARADAEVSRPGLPMGASLEDVVNVAADAILLATPPGGREAQIETACAAGLPILAEKPLADDVGLAYRFVEMAEAAGVHLIVGLNFRYLAVTVAKKRLLTSGVVGTPGFARFTYERWRDGTQSWLNSYPLTMDQPMLWEQSIHHFDLLRFVYETDPLHIQAHTFNPPWTMYRDDTNVSALIAFKNGMSVNYQGTWQAGHEPMHFNWRTDCTGGIVEQRAMFGDLGYAPRMQKDLTPVDLPPHEPWITDAAALLKNFTAIFRGTAPPACTGRDHLQSLYMLQACILATSRRAAVEIAEIEDLAAAGKEISC